MNLLRKKILELRVVLHDKYALTWFSKHIERNHDYIYQESLRRQFRTADGVRFGSDIIIHDPQYISLGEGHIGHHVILTVWKNHKGCNYDASLEIGNGFDIGEYTHITAIGHMRIGKNLLTGRWVTISDNNHGCYEDIMSDIPPINRKLYYKGPVIIGDNVWIGDKATILSGVSIGNNAIIAANTVVTHDVPAFSVVAGNPAKIIQKGQ